MPINSPHPEHEKFNDIWQKCRDAVDGQAAIKDAGETYLPRLSGHTRDFTGESAYQAYKARALWFGATDRTLRGYVGAIMRNDPSFDVPDIFKPRLADITDAGQTAVQFVHTMVKELITTGRLGLLVDKDPNDPDELPYIKLYYPENILNWITEDDNVLAVTLQETIFKQIDDDPYMMQPETQVRELKLDSNGEYTVNIWSQATHSDGDLTEQYQISESYQPKLRGDPLESLPFFFASSDEDNISVSKPPIIDLVDANINHYQLDADYRHGLHFTALPTAVFTGVEEGKEYYLGSEGALILRNENAKAFFLEFQGLGLSAIKQAMEERKTQMAALGAQLIQRGQPGKGVETAEAARIQNSGETSLLATIVGRVEECLRQAIVYACIWAGVPTENDDVKVNINRDFIDATLQAADVVALTQAFQAGAVTQDVLFWNFQRGGLIDPKLTLDEFVKNQQAEKWQKVQDEVARTKAIQAIVPPQDVSSQASNTQPHTTVQDGVLGGSGALNNDGVSNQ